MHATLFRFHLGKCFRIRDHLCLADIDSVTENRMKTTKFGAGTERNVAKFKGCEYFRRTGFPAAAAAG